MSVSFIAITIISAAVYWILFQAYRKRGPSIFCAKVSGALYDLGLQPMKFGSELNKMFLADCNAYFEKNGGNSNPHEMAAQFYIKAILDYSAFAEPAAVCEDVIVRPISVVRVWLVDNKISEKSEALFTNKMKVALFESVEDQDMTTEMKMATKIQILEL